MQMLDSAVGEGQVAPTAYFTADEVRPGMAMISAHSARDVEDAVPYEAPHHRRGGYHPPAQTEPILLPILGDPAPYPL